MGSAEFTKYLAVRMEEYPAFYDAIGYARDQARSRPRPMPYFSAARGGAAPSGNGCRVTLRTIASIV